MSPKFREPPPVDVTVQWHIATYYSDLRVTLGQTHNRWVMCLLPPAFGSQESVSWVSWPLLAAEAVCNAKHSDVSCRIVPFQIQIYLCRIFPFRAVPQKRRIQFGSFWIHFRPNFMILGTTYVWIFGQHIFGLFQILGFPDFQISSCSHSH